MMTKSASTGGMQLLGLAAVRMGVVDMEHVVGSANWRTAPCAVVAQFRFLRDALMWAGLAHAAADDSTVMSIMTDPMAELPPFAMPMIVPAPRKGLSKYAGGQIDEIMQQQSKCITLQLQAVASDKKQLFEQTQRAALMPGSGLQTLADRTGTPPEQVRIVPNVVSLCIEGPTGCVSHVDIPKQLSRCNQLQQSVYSSSKHQPMIVASGDESEGLSELSSEGGD